MAVDPNMTVVRDYSLANNISPTGRKLGIVKVANTSLYRIGFVDDRPGKLPDEMGDEKFTRTDIAQEYLTRYLKKLWEESDAASARAAKRAQEEALATQRMIEAMDPTKKNASAAA